MTERLDCSNWLAGGFPSGTRGWENPTVMQWLSEMNRFFSLNKPIRTPTVLCHDVSNATGSMVFFYSECTFHVYMGIYGKGVPTIGMYHAEPSKIFQIVYSH